MHRLETKIVTVRLTQIDLRCILHLAVLAFIGSSMFDFNTGFQINNEVEQFLSACQLVKFIALLGTHVR